MRANIWATRLMHERSYWNEAVFVTLTYNNESIPNEYNLCKEDVQKFLKRFRKNIEPRKIKYFISGEYGEKYGRPHYHGIFFGVGFGDNVILERCWNKGFVTVKNVDRTSCKYCAKYITKTPLGKTRLSNALFGRVNEFQVQSRGIGLRWIMERAKDVGERGILYHGKNTSVSRYYVDKIKSAGVSAQFFEDAKADGVQRRNERKERWVKAGNSIETFSDNENALRKQRSEEIRTKDQMRGNRDFNEQ